jgi:hypothetical protein
MRDAPVRSSQRSLLRTDSAECEPNVGRLLSGGYEVERRGEDRESFFLPRTFGSNAAVELTANVFDRQPVDQHAEAIRQQAVGDQLVDQPIKTDRTALSNRRRETRDTFDTPLAFCLVHCSEIRNG